MAKRRIFHGWYIVFCGFLGNALRLGLGSQTFGFFFKPMLTELGWSRTMLTGGLVARDLVRMALDPLFGFAQDRYGPRFLMVFSAFMLGLSTLLLSQVSSPWHFVLFFGVIGAFGIPGLQTVIGPTLAKWFVRKRGFAMGIAHAGVNVGAIALTPLILWLLSQYGWRSAWVALGLIPWLLMIPPALIWLRRQPEDLVQPGEITYPLEGRFLLVMRSGHPCQTGNIFRPGCTRSTPRWRHGTTALHPACGTCLNGNRGRELETA